MTPVRFTPLARQEAIEARAWYENQACGLGRDFFSSVANTVERIQANPLHFPVLHRQIRRAMLPRFPYSLFFVLNAEHEAIVLACFHASRNPVGWKQRM